jgi:ABC-type multidrug transport system fused ATPase/permease subunit
MGAFHYVWPTTAVLGVRLAACFVLVMMERCINLATPILYKSLVESLTNFSTTALPAMLRHLQEAAPVGSPSGPAGLFHSIIAGLKGDAPANLAVFWGVFYPWAFFYLAAFLLRGGSGSEGLLANVRDVLWIPITQAAFRRISNDVFGHLLALDLNWHVHRKTGQIMRILDRGTSSIQVRGAGGQGVAHTCWCTVCTWIFAQRSFKHYLRTG